MKRPPGKAGLFAASALTKVMSGDITKGLTIAVGKPAYNPTTNTLYLPGIPGSDLPDPVLDRLLAYLGHEAAERGRSTWMPSDPRWATNPSLKGLVNAINDARIDLLQAEEYPGWGMKMRAVRMTQAKKMVAAYRKGECAANYNAMGMLCVFVGEGLMDLPQLHTLFPTWAKFLNRAAPILAHLDLSTEDRCIEQALALYAALQSQTTHDSTPQTPQQNPPTRPGAPVPPGERSDGDASDSENAAADEPSDGGRAAGDAASDESLSPDAPAHAGPGDGDGDPTDDAGKAEADSGSEGAAEPSADSAPDARPGPATHVGSDDGEPLADGDGPTLQDTLLDDIVSDIFKATHSKFDANKYTAYTFDPSEDRVVLVPPDRGVLDRSQYGNVAQALTTKLRQVMTTQEPKFVRNLDKGELDERAIGRFVAGDTRVFRRRVRQESDDVAVTLSWDESSSMRGEKENTVLHLAYTFNEALGLLSIPTEMLGWSTDGGRVKNPDVYRTARLVHRIYKQFGERWDDPTVLRRLARIDVRGETPTAEGLMFAAERLGRRPERRRVLFFLTDGQPGCAVRGDAKVHHEFIKTLVGRCASAGIELIGFGIRCTVSHLFPVSFMIRDLDELRTTASDELLKMLRSTRRLT